MSRQTGIYTAFTCYEIFRLVILLHYSALTGQTDPVLLWYLAVPLLVLPAGLFVSLALNEYRFKDALPLITLIKGLSLTGAVAYIIRSFPDAVRFGGLTSFVGLRIIGVALLLALVDLIPGIYCALRGRSVCT